MRISPEKYASLVAGIIGDIFAATPTDLAPEKVHRAIELLNQKLMAQSITVSERDHG